MKTITIGLPLEIVGLMSDGATLNPSDIRFFLYSIYMEDVVAQEFNTLLYPYSLKVDERLREELVERAKASDMTLLHYTASLFEVYYYRFRQRNEL